MSPEQHTQLLIASLGEQVGSAAINVLSLQIELADLNANFSAVAARSEQLDLRIENDAELIEELRKDRDLWRSKAEGVPLKRPSRAK
jgi:hypothetical protein